ncbi:hypothetical protein QBC47DRAFT_391644 [Echria macrotheca]|uniref:Uncharacterized protein n=1 Tax=Echria macrotheca TaxID=438768 RepID=A0AAJ0F2N5_9PEZI|nr:hypothetical protein QBC47DRAFT_391644 [Echria macrotheca]
MPPDGHILRKIWPRLPEHELSTHEADYARILDHLLATGKALDAPSSTLGPMSMDDITDIIAEIRRLRSLSRAEVVSTVRQKFQQKSLCEVALPKAVDLAASLWLTANIRSDVGLLFVSSPGICWGENANLEALLQTAFQLPQRVSPGDTTTPARIQSNLTMANLVANFGFKVRWTHNICEHLSIDWVGRVITVYEHKICLWNHLRFKEDTVLPAAILEEAIDTLNLLFPFGDAATEILLKKHCLPFYGLGYCGRQRTLNIRDYSYWRKPIEELQRVLDGPPSGLQQLALDRNRSNMLAFTTFWIAAAVAVLAVAGLVAGVLSTVYSKRQYDIALLQYQLSLAQACAAPGAADQLPEFCH